MVNVFWFEISVADMDRAVSFYNTILATELKTGPAMGDARMAMLPGGHGALLQGSDYSPGEAGVIVYLDGDPDLDLILNRVEAAGGKVLWPKGSIGENGFVGGFVDSEGNRIGLHSSH